MEERIRWAWRQALSREPGGREVALLSRLYREQLIEYRSDGESARRLASIGLSPPPEDIDLAELAAWTAVARAVLNLNETITRN